MRDVLDEAPHRLVSSTYSVRRDRHPRPGPAWALFGRRPDKSYSFTDCSSFVLMRRERIERAVALDAHFAQEGFAVLPR